LEGGSPWPLESTTVGESWKDRASRSRCTASSTWEWSQNEVTQDPVPQRALQRRRSSRIQLAPVPLQRPPPVEAAPVSVDATVATEKFNYLAIFPNLAKRKPMPTRRLFLTEAPSPTGAPRWKIDELLVHQNHGQETESVVAPSELSEARRLLEHHEDGVRRTSSVFVNEGSRSMSISQSEPCLQEKTFITKTVPSVEPSPQAQGLSRQLMSLPYDDFRHKLLKDREAQACDPSPQRLFDRSFRRDLVMPPAMMPPATKQSRANLRAKNGLPPLVQKGSNWEPEREYQGQSSPNSAMYLRSCLSQFVLPELLPFFTGHSKSLDAENRQLTDKDILAMAEILHHIHPNVINLGNNVLLTDKSMVPFLETVMKLPSGCLGTLKLHHCHLGYDSCVKMTSLLESEAASRSLRVLNLNGISLSLAVQVHLAGTIREHDKLRELSLADTQLSMECLQSIAENHQLELLDLSWNSIDAECFAALGLSLMNNMSLHTLSLAHCSMSGSSSGPPMSSFLECLFGIQNLEHLDISSNQIDHRGALILEDVLAHHQHLKKMNVSENPLGQLGVRCLLRLLCTETASLKRFDGAGCFIGEAPTLGKSQFFRPSSPGGLYQLDFTQAYHRSLFRMLAKTAERLKLQLPEAFTSVAGPMPLPEKVDNHWVVQTRGNAKFRFNVEKCMGRGLTEKLNFVALLEPLESLLKQRLPKRKQMQLLLQFWSMRCQIQEQVVFLNALSQDFIFDAPQVLQLCDREIAPEVLWRLWHGIHGPGGTGHRYLTLLQGSPSLSCYVNVLRQTEQLYNFNAQNPNGHYRLDLANCADFELGRRLLVLDKWESLLRIELKRRDVGRRPGGCIYDESYEGTALTQGLAEYTLGERGILEFEYASGKRPDSEEIPLSEESFRKFCQAFLCSQLSAEAKVAALRPVSHHFNFTAFQLRSLCFLTASAKARGELFELFLLRVVDIENLKLVLDTLDPGHRHPWRLNQCFTFPYIQPEDYEFELNLKFADHRLASLVVFKLCEVEGWSSVQDPSFSSNDPADEANFWRSSHEASLDNMPQHGIFKGKYLGFLSGTRNLKCRRQLLEQFGFWSASSITEDQVCWCTRPEAPIEIIRLVHWLMLRYTDVIKAFPQILKKVPEGLQTAGSMTLEEFDKAMCALKIQRLDESGVAAAYRYLAINDSLTQATWKKLEPFVTTLRLNVRDFIGFMQSIAGDLMEDWWQLLAPDSSEVGLAQWNDACRSFGYHGDSGLTYQLLEEDGNTISWTEFQQLAQFR